MPDAQDNNTVRNVTPVEQRVRTPTQATTARPHEIQWITHGGIVADVSTRHFELIENSRTRRSPG
jgi:hypothetical protein